MRKEQEYISNPGNLVKDQNDNAQLWAKAFMYKIELGIFKLEDIDEALMISWFASAIETGKDKLNSEFKKVS